jgi:ADP-ribose pyrophosphatase YjhB (NUDIX family)
MLSFQWAATPFRAKGYWATWRTLRGERKCSFPSSSQYFAVHDRPMPVSACVTVVPRDAKFCPSCASEMIFSVPPGDERQRLVCSSESCGRVVYNNPKVTVATVVMTANRKTILLAKRAIDPALGKWNIPGGFLEKEETLEEGVKRETWEEARASIHVLDLLGIYTIMAASQVQLVYLSILLDNEVSPGPESEEVRLFTWADVPWDDIAFTTHKWALLAALNHISIGDISSPLVPERRVKPLDYVD